MESTESNETSYCDMVESPDVMFFVLTCVLSILSVSSLMMHGFFSFLLWRSAAFSSNVRFLLQNLSIASFYVSLHTLARCFFNSSLARMQLAQVAATPMHCELIETLYSASLTSLTFSVAFIGLDRCISTLQRAHSESERPTFRAYVMVVVCWTFGFAFNVVVLVTMPNEERTLSTVCYCHTTLALTMHMLYVAVPGFLFLEVATGLCYIFLFRYSQRSFTNFTINTAQHSLTERHHMISNIKTSVILFPSVIVHGCVYAIFFISLIPLRLNIQAVHYTTYLNYLMLLLILLELETLFHPIQLMIRRDTLRKAVVYYMPVLSRLLASKNADIISTDLAGPNTSVKNSVDLNQPVKPRLTIKPGLVEYRVKPEQSEDILNALWAAKPQKKR